MGMKQTLEEIGTMEAAGVIGRYAISGAVAAFNYVEAAVTQDLDILISFDEALTQGSSGLLSLSPIYSYLRSKGYEEHRKEGIMIGGWPVRFLPTRSMRRRFSRRRRSKSSLVWSREL